MPQNINLCSERCCICVQYSIWNTFEDHYLVVSNTTDVFYLHHIRESETVVKMSPHLENKAFELKFLTVWT